MAEKGNGSIDSGIFKGRRNRIRKAAGDGVILWLGHVLQPRNYLANTYPFRQNSNFLYYTGLAEPDLALLSYPEEDSDVLFSRPATMDDVVWSGAGLDRLGLARRAGIETVEHINRLGVYLAKAAGRKQKIHYLPPYQPSAVLRLAELLVVDFTEAVAGASERLVEEVVRQRSVKTDMEIAEIEDALEVTAAMYETALGRTRPGLREHDIAGAIQGVALARNREQAFNPIVTVRGEVLHNHCYDNLLAEGKLLLVDAGAESPGFYASDITRTFPVSGRFNPAQKEIYETVLRMQLGAIEMMRPGVPYRDVHIQACRILFEGLKAVGLAKGDTEEAVAAGAHSLFFPHGLGHMLGLDVHDMEDLGDIVGYPKGEKRSEQFGLKFLRFSRELEPGFVLTVEPGIYFIPALMERWQQERSHEDFICYDKLASFREFGGIRIEDDVLVTENGALVLGKGIPKTVDAIEEAMAR